MQLPVDGGGFFMEESYYVDKEIQVLIGDKPNIIDMFLEIVSDVKNIRSMSLEDMINHDPHIILIDELL